MARRLPKWNRARLYAALAAAAFLVAAGLAVRLVAGAKRYTVTVSAGHTEGHEVLGWMNLDGPAPGLLAKPVVTEGTLDMLRRVDRGELDFAFVQGGFDIDRFRNVRQVAGLTVIPLNLLVKGELYESVAADLGALRGKRINLGSGKRTGTYWLSRELLEFAGLAPGDYEATAWHVEQLREERDGSKLPDAIFVVLEPPSALVRHLITDERYRLVPLPYGEAFRLQALDPSANTPAEGIVVRKEHIPDAVIPAYSYGASPPRPPRELPTVGSRLLLVTHRRTPSAAVVRVLEALFASRWARAVRPPIDKGVLRLPPEVALHPGAVEFRDRDQPLVTGELIGLLSNALQIVLPLGGGLLFLFGWLRSRTSAGRESSYDHFFALVSAVERQGAALERGGALDDEALHRLNRELSTIKDSAFHYVAGSEIGVEGFTAVLLAQIADVRSSLAELLRRGGGPDGRPRGREPEETRRDEPVSLDETAERSGCAEGA